MDEVNSKPSFQLGLPGSLGIEDVIAVARRGRTVPSPPLQVWERIEQSAAWVDSTVSQVEKGLNPQPYYGINTGFGNQAGKAVLRSRYQTRLLSYNLIASHAVGVGPYLDEDVVRAAMLIRLHTLAQGYSGVRPILIQKLIDMLNQGVYPAVPSQGSLGSGDLPQLAHLALLIAKPPVAEQPPGSLLEAIDGEALVKVTSPADAPAETYLHLTVDRYTEKQIPWKRVWASQAMAGVGGQIELEAKEGLALISGSTFSAAIAALVVHDANMVLANAELATAMTLEAIRGFRDPFLPTAQSLYRHSGSQRAAATILDHVQGSTLLDGDEQTDPQRTPPQDPISIRAAAQVLGAVHDTLEFVERTVTTELNAVTDNPLICLDLPRAYKTVSCGNFQCESLALAMDFLGIALAELGDISERHTFKLTDYTFIDPALQETHGLEAFLIKELPDTTGLNSGLMIPQYTAASLVNECRVLAHPNSIDSTSSSANKEDLLTMSFNAARSARQIIDNAEKIVAIELMCAAQALSIRLDRAKAKGRSFRLGQSTRFALDQIRNEVAFLDMDRVLYLDIRNMICMVRQGKLLPETSNRADSG